jgi:uncharacterized protein (TIGR02598 family)
MKFAPPKVQPSGSRQRGFSLVEVTLAIGIVSFAFLAILGLIPIGLQTFRSAIDTSVSAQIFQRVINEAQQTDFDTLVDRPHLPDYPSLPPAGFTFRAPSVGAPALRYFDDQGNECPATKAIYYVNTRIIVSTELPNSASSASANFDLAMITVQIANNPGRFNLEEKFRESAAASDPNSPLRQLWKANPAFTVLTHSTLVARNK